ncbi:hypothetical protein KY290_003216, partial [Solanum tuberosum]
IQGNHSTSCNGRICRAWMLLLGESNGFKILIKSLGGILVRRSMKTPVHSAVETGAHARHIFDLAATEIDYQFRSHGNAKLRDIGQDLSHIVGDNKDGESSVEILYKAPRSKHRHAEETEEEEYEDEEEEEEQNEWAGIVKKNTSCSKAGYQRETARKVRDSHDQFGADIFKSGHATQPRNPYFIAKLQAKRRDQLYVPIDVVKAFNFELPSSITIRDSTGREFETKHKNWKDGRIWLIGGWHSLCRWNLVEKDVKCICEFVKGKGNEVLYLQVQILHEGSVSNSNTKHMEEEDEGEEDNDDDDEEEEETEEDEETQEDERTGTFKKNMSRSEVGCKRDIACKVRDVPDQYGADIFKSGRATQPKNPYFVAKIRTKRRDQLYIPIDVVRDYKLELPSRMIIRDSAGREFETKLKNWKDGRIWLAGGWCSLCRWNLVEKDDRCICEFVRGKGKNGLYLQVHHSTSHHNQVGGQKTMATMTTFSAATVSSAAIIGTGRNSSQKGTKVKYISGLNSFEGLKANNHVASLGLPLSTEQAFAKIVSSLKTPSSQANGGALSSTCNAALEIFRIATIIPGLVLVGVAVGFVLLRIEATVEESE